MSQSAGAHKLRGHHRVHTVAIKVELRTPFGRDPPGHYPELANAGAPPVLCEDALQVLALGAQPNGPAEELHGIEVGRELPHVLIAGVERGDVAETRAELRRVAEAAHGKAERFNQQRERLAEIAVVVHDEDGRRRIVGGQRHSE